MMNLLAGVFAGMGMLFGGMFGHHAVMNADASSTPPGDHMMGTSTPDGARWGGMMGSTTPAVIGKVVSISGTTLTVTGRSADNATTTYTVDASAAKVMKGKQTATSTPATLSNVAVGDNVVVVGTTSGTSITAKVIIDGLPPQRMMNPSLKPGTHMGTTSVMRRGDGNANGNGSNSTGPRQ